MTDTLAFSRRAFGGLAIGVLPFFVKSALAYPDKVITIVVPFAPGGSTDLAGRLMADRLGPLLSITVADFTGL